MPLPSNWNLVTLTGKFIGTDGTAVSGRIIFTPRATRLLDLTEDTILIGRSIAVTLEDDGSFEIDLPATDDPDVTPIDWTYQVREDFTGGSTYNIEIPIAAEGTGIELSDISPVDPASGIGNPVLGEPGPPGEPGPAGAPGGSDAAFAAWIADRDSDTYGAGLAAFAGYTNISDATGVDPTGVTECSAALQTAISGVEALGARPMLVGTFRTDDTVDIASACDFSQAVINYEGTGTALRVGQFTSGTYLFDVGGPILLPKVVNTDKVSTGWAGVAGSIGVQVSNIYSAIINIPEVNNFETGLKPYGIGQGVSYVTFNLGHMYNNKVNCLLDADADGWVNQNTFVGGRMSHNSEEGTDLAGVCHVKLADTAHPINGNLFSGTSLETSDVVEYQVDQAGINNMFVGCRWENTGGAARIVNRTGAVNNMIVGGYNSNWIAQTDDGGALHTVLADSESVMVSNGGVPLRLQNNSGSSAASLYITKASETGDPTTEYGTKLSAWMAQWKNPVSDYGSVVIDGANWLIGFGDGTAPYDVYFERTAAQTLHLEGRLLLDPSSSSRAGLNIPAGTAPSSPVDGDVWTTTAGHFVRINGVTQQTANRLTATATLDFGSITSWNSAELTITVTGAAVGDAVLLGPPSSMPTGISWQGYVSATNTVTVRLFNNTGGAIDPASATWRATVVR